MQNPAQNSLTDYEIIKMEPTQILMRNKDTRKIYRYCQLSETKPICKIQCPDIIHPMQIETGLLYEAGYTTLAAQMQCINKGSRKCTFEESEILNTVEPIIKVIRNLHQHGFAHEAITPSNVVLDEMGNLKVYYPGLRQSIKNYYSNTKIKKEADFRALAIIIIQLLGFQIKNYDDEIKILRLLTKVQKYSQSFIFALYCMLQYKTEFISQAIQFCNNSSNNDLSATKLQGEAKQIYENQILEKHKKVEAIKRVAEKVEFTPPLLKHSDHTPKKTLQITKKYVRVEDVENKKVHEEKKKKAIDQPLKKVSNSKVDGQNNANVGSPSYKKILRDIRQTKERQDLFKMAVTVKRMRTVSKKKIN